MTILLWSYQVCFYLESLLNRGIKVWLVFINISALILIDINKFSTKYHEMFLFFPPLTVPLCPIMICPSSDSSAQELRHPTVSSRWTDTSRHINADTPVQKCPYPDIRYKIWFPIEGPLMTISSISHGLSWSDWFIWYHSVLHWSLPVSLQTKSICITHYGNVFELNVIGKLQLHKTTLLMTCVISESKLKIEIKLAFHLSLWLLCIVLTSLILTYQISVVELAG